VFFWIIVLSFLVPVAMRLYRRSVRGRNQGMPDQFGRFPGDRGNAGNQGKQPRDGYTQQDYFGGFGQLGAPRQQPGPANQQYPGQQYPVPYEDSPEYLSNPPQPQRHEPAPQAGQPQIPQTPQAPQTPQPPSVPQGYRARKLAELDQQYSEGKLSMEDYMAQRADIMKG